VRVGQECIRLQNSKMRNIKSEEIQIDEIWGFVGAKRGNARQAGMHGDVWTFIALDRDTKLIPSFWVGQRTMEHARYFLLDLKKRLASGRGGEKWTKYRGLKFRRASAVY
jgi:IS1 family transposase